ncbi:hypothetical protein FWD07_01285 [Candidatus Saccharibacteria bacterium]|nr:hypothetical protein [Candidatus Saccharibacteria bacterium]
MTYITIYVTIKPSYDWPDEKKRELHGSLLHQIAYGEGSEIFKKHTVLLYYWAVDNCQKDPDSSDRNWIPIKNHYNTFVSDIPDSAHQAIIKLLDTPGSLFSQTPHTLKFLNSNGIISRQRALAELWAASVNSCLANFNIHTLVIIGNIAQITNTSQPDTQAAAQQVIDYMRNT